MFSIQPRFFFFFFFCKRARLTISIPVQIYATSEERKQRNRQAQAAFRERRTEYIKQLESTIKRNEDSLQSLQQSHRTAADECLMLRYKNSLLERILLEKGEEQSFGFLHRMGLTILQASMCRQNCDSRRATRRQSLLQQQPNPATPSHPNNRRL
jgi:hypothetical protein